jgi:hypothetical protein
MHFNLINYYIVCVTLVVVVAGLQGNQDYSFTVKINNCISCK